LQRDRTADARTRQEALQATRRQIDATQDAAERTRLQAQEQQQRTDLEKAVNQSQVDLQNLQRQISNELGVKVKAAIQDVVKGDWCAARPERGHHGGLVSTRTRSDLARDPATERSGCGAPRRTSPEARVAGVICFRCAVMR
jgi:hypothetical protein